MDNIIFFSQICTYRVETGFGGGGDVCNLYIVGPFGLRPSYVGVIIASERVDEEVFRTVQNPGRFRVDDVDFEGAAI